MQSVVPFPGFPRLAMLWAALALAGCASVGPEYRAPALAVPETWQTAPAGTAETAPERLARWWAQLDDPLLSGLIEQALEANPDLAAARAALREARARRRVAGADRAIDLTASGTASRSAPGGGSASTLYSADLDASWEADVFGGIRRGIEAAQADYQYARATLADAQVSIAAEVALNYVGLRSYQQRLAIARANLESQTETLQLTRWRVKAGLASSVELQQARSNREQTAAQIPTLETGRIQAAYALAVLLGEPPGGATRVAGPGTLPAIPRRIAIGIPADTLRQRPDVRAAERKLAAETARIGVATAKLYPALRLSGSIGVEAASLGALAGADIARSLLAGVTGTLFDGGRLRGQVDIQQAVQEQALANYRAAVLTALQVVEVALVALEHSRLREEALTRAADAARAAALLARQRYQGGLIDFQTVLETDRTRLSVEDSLAGVRADRVTALIQLYKALGGGWAGSVPQPAKS